MGQANRAKRRLAGRETQFRRRAVRPTEFRDPPDVVWPGWLGHRSRTSAFQQTRKIGAFSHSYNLDPTNPIHPTLQIDAADLVSSATSSGLGVDNVGTQATSDVASASFVLTDHPPFAAGILGLSVSADLVHSASYASYVFGANRGFLGGDASFGSLTIGGALIGKTLTFSGDAAANTVLFQSSSVTITLDKQILSDFLPPSPAAGTGAGTTESPPMRSISTSTALISSANWFPATSYSAKARPACFRLCTAERPQYPGNSLTHCTRQPSGSRCSRVSDRFWIDRCSALSGSIRNA